jgi:hypothetical protein
VRIAAAHAAIAAALLVAACGSVKWPATTDAPAAGSPTPATAPATAPTPAPAPAPAPVKALTPAVERQALEHVDKMRLIKPATDARQAAEYNTQLEEAWKFFIANPEVIAVLRRALAREVGLPQRNDFLLLDLGYYVHEHGTPADRELAKSALYSLDPKAPILRFNQQEFFQFTQSVAAARDTRALAFIDRVFLRDQIAVRFPEADLTLDATTACAFLYGAYGDGAEAWLRPKLHTPVTDRDLVRRVLDILGWTGSPASNPEVKNVLIGASRDYETFTRTTSFLMNAGGPQGRSIVLAVQPNDLDVWTRSYYDKIYPQARVVSYERQRENLSQVPAAKAILDSERPRAELIAELTKKRNNLFRTVTKESIAEIQRTNALINALRYRDS